MTRLVCRMPLLQTQESAEALGRMIVEGLNRAAFPPKSRCLYLSDATRGAVVYWLNIANHSRMKDRELVAIDNLPICLDNRLRFGDVFIEED